MKATHYVLMGLLVIGLTVSCSSQDNRPPEDVVREWTDALKATDFAKMAAVMHPEALAEFKEILLPVMQGFQESIAQDTSGVAQVPDSLKQQLQGISELAPEQFYPQAMTVLTSIVPDLRQSLGDLNSTVLGSVAEGDSLTHVVRRTQASYMGQQMISDVDVVSVKRSNGNWRILLTGNIRGLAEGIRGAFFGRG